MSDLVNVIIEVEKHSNMKWEYDRVKDQLYLDRVLSYPYFYPYAYGFFTHTLGNDGDELDILLITDKMYPNYNTLQTSIEGYIVGGLMMHDEKGTDEKIFVVPMDEIDEYNCKSESEKQRIEENITWFFSNYKLKDHNRWSRVEQPSLTKDEAICVYKNAYSRWVKSM